MLQRITRRINDVIRIIGSPTFPRRPLLLSPGLVQQFLTEGTTAVPIIGPDGKAIWFNCSPALGIFDPSSRQISYIPTPSGTMQDILVGPDGNVWFSSMADSVAPNGNGIGWATPGGVVQFLQTEGAVTALAAGPDRVWFNQENGASGGGWVSTVDYSLHLFRTTFQTVDPLAAPGGGAWFGELGAKLASVNANGDVVEYTTNAMGFTGSLAYDGAGNLWYGTYAAIGYIDPSGTQHEFNIGGQGAFSILFGNQLVWFASSFSNQIGSISYDGSGLQLYGISGMPAGLVFGSDGNPWFTEFADMLGTIAAGTVHEYPTHAQQPYPPILGADGNVWFSDAGNIAEGIPTYVGRVTPQGDVAEYQTNGIPSGLLMDTATLWIYFGENARRLGRVFVGASV